MTIPRIFSKEAVAEASKGVNDALSRLRGFT